MAKWASKATHTERHGPIFVQVNTPVDPRIDDIELVAFEGGKVVKKRVFSDYATVDEAIERLLKSL